MKVLLAIASLCLCAATATARDDNPNVDAIWLPQVVNFVYRSSDTFYTCSGLWQKVTGILSNLGARAAAPVDRLNCEDFANTVRLQIALESPVEATAENLRTITDYDTKDVLVARLRGASLPSESDVTRFPAAWTTLSLRGSRMQLTAGDCELVQQVRRQILPKLSVQIVKEPRRCTSLSRAGLSPSMKVRALLVAG